MFIGFEWSIIVLKDEEATNLKNDEEISGL